MFTRTGHHAGSGLIVFCPILPPISDVHSLPVTPSIQSHASDVWRSLSAVTSTLPGSGSWSYTTLPVCTLHHIRISNTTTDDDDDNIADSLAQSVNHATLDGNNPARLYGSACLLGLFTICPLFHLRVRHVPIVAVGGVPSSCPRAITILCTTSHSVAHSCM